MSLTSDPKGGGPARRYFDRYLNGHRSIQRSWRSAIGDVVVSRRADCAPGDFGLAADHLLVGAAVNLLGWGTAGYDIALAVNPRVADQLREIVESPLDDRDRAARASWYCGLLDSVGRGFRLTEDHPLAAYRDATSLESAFERVPRGVVDELIELLEANREHICELPSPRLKGPHFASSGLVGGADCDLLVGTHIVELKTVSDRALDRDFLRQLVGYALLDTTDEFGITHVTLWFTRHAFSMTWNVEELLFELSGGSTLTLTERREAFRDSLVNVEFGPVITPSQRKRVARGQQLALFELSATR